MNADHIPLEKLGPLVARSAIEHLLNGTEIELHNLVLAVQSRNVNKNTITFKVVGVNKKALNEPT